MEAVVYEKWLEVILSIWLSIDLAWLKFEEALLEDLVISYL